MSNVGKRLIGAAKEAAAIARGDKKAARVHIPADVDVKAIRHELKLSQEDFASNFGFSPNQIRDWEQRRTRPIGGVRAYLMLIERAPDEVLRMLEGLRTAPKVKKAA